MLEGGADVRWGPGDARPREHPVDADHTRVSIQKLREVHAATHPGAKLTPRAEWAAEARERRRTRSRRPTLAELEAERRRRRVTVARRRRGRSLGSAPGAWRTSSLAALSSRAQRLVRGRCAPSWSIARTLVCALVLAAGARSCREPGPHCAPHDAVGVRASRRLASGGSGRFAY